MKKNHFYNTVMLITFMGEQCLSHFRLMVLNGKKILKFNEVFIKNYDEDSNKGYILEVDVDILKICMICIVIWHSYQK